MQNLVIVSHTMCTNEEGPRNIRDAGTLALRIEDVADT